MKTFRLICFWCICLGLSAITRNLHGQDASRTVDQTFEFDEKGDAKIQITFEYGAAQWAQWKEQFGNHPDMMLRNLRYQFASAVIEEFSLDRDDIQRRATGKMKARALAQYRSGGRFNIAVPKNMKLVTGSGKEWVFTNSSIMNGELVSQTLRAKLPAKATDAHFVIGGDYDQLTYKLDMAPARSLVWIEIGAVLIILAIALAVLSFRKNQKNLTPPPPSMPPGPPPLPLPAI